MVGRVANAPPTALPVNGSCMAAICGLGHHRAERQEPPPLNLRDAMTRGALCGRKIASNLIRFTSSNLSWQ